MRRRRAYCVACAAALLLLVATGAQACVAQRIDARAQADFVYDGDTVRLADGRKMRIIGLDAPELEHHSGRPDQPFARQAAASLDTLLARHDYRILIRYGIEMRDQYGRWLAHLYLPNKRSIAAQLLRQGLATRLTVPPNVFALDCYRRVEARAIAEEKGVWRLPEYQIVASMDLERDARGFRRVRGMIVRVGYSRSAMWLNLPGNVALRIEREDLENFPRRDFPRWQGLQVTARGWLYEFNGELRMPIRHPAALESVH